MATRFLKHITMATQFIKHSFSNFSHVWPVNCRINCQLLFSNFVSELFKQYSFVSEFFIKNILMRKVEESEIEENVLVLAYFQDVWKWSIHLWEQFIYSALSMTINVKQRLVSNGLDTSTTNITYTCLAGCMQLHVLCSQFPFLSNYFVG